MKIMLLACGLFLSSFIAITEGPWFSGKIIYHNTFTTLAGADVSDKLSPVLGAENLYYISDDNYKTYTEKKQLLQLYTGSTNQSQFFMNGQVASTTDAATGTPGAVVTPLAQKATIAGYPCQSLQIVNDGITTVYFYSPKLRVNPERFAKHQMGDWYTYLKASKGALPLRFTLTNTKQGFIMTSEATTVQAMPLGIEEFTLSALPR
jgi:hypothetical protein